MVLHRNEPQGSDDRSPTSHQEPVAPPARRPVEWLLADWPELALHLADVFAIAAPTDGTHSLMAQIGADAQDWGDGDFAFDSKQHRVVRRLFVRLLQLQHPAATAVAAQLTLKPLMFAPTDDTTSQDQRAIDAQTIAQLRPDAEVIALLDASEGVRVDDPEMGLLLAHERGAMGQPPTESDRWYGEWAHATKHPLAVLPATLLPIERELPSLCRRVSVDTDTMTLCSTMGLPWSRRGSEAIELGSALPGLDGRIDISTSQVGAPFREWVDDSNGRCVIRAFTRGQRWPVGDSSHDQVSPHLPVRPIAAEMGVAILFAAVGRGAHTSFISGSYARLRAWESIAGVFGQPWPSSLATLTDAAARARWFEVALPQRAGHPIWSIGLIIESDDRVISIRATDVD